MLERLDLKELSDYLSANSKKKITLTFHSMGDRDGVSSAIALSKYLKNSAIITPDFITRHALQMLEAAGFKSTISSEFDAGSDILIVLDANTPDALGALKARLNSFKGEILYVDHHFLPSTTKYNGITFNDESYNSTASIVYKVLKSLRFQIDKQSAKLLINGIVADSADFQNVTAETFMQISELLEITGDNYTEVVARVHGEISPENRYRTLNDISRSTVEMVGRHVIVYGKCNTNANLVADQAIRIGADASVFWMTDSKEASISARLRSPLDSKLKIHLGQIMQANANIIGGTGGGHPCAAGAYGPRKDRMQAMAMEIVREVSNKLRKNK